MARIVRGRTKRSRRAVKLKERACLRCDRVFLSEGPHNRLCDVCRALLDAAPTPSPEYSLGYP
jgi:hypothetical protein